MRYFGELAIIFFLLFNIISLQKKILIQRSLSKFKISFRLLENYLSNSIDYIWHIISLERNSTARKVNYSNNLNNTAILILTKFTWADSSVCWNFAIQICLILPESMKILTRGYSNHMYVWVQDRNCKSEEVKMYFYKPHT